MVPRWPRPGNAYFELDLPALRNLPFALYLNSCIRVTTTNGTIDARILAVTWHANGATLDLERLA